MVDHPSALRFDCSPSQLPFPASTPYPFHPVVWVGAFVCVQSSIPCLLLSQQLLANTKHAKHCHIQTLFPASTPLPAIPPHTPSTPWAGLVHLDVCKGAYLVCC